MTKTEADTLRAENARLLRLLREVGLGAVAVAAEHAREIGKHAEVLRTTVEDARLAGEEGGRALAAANTRTDNLQTLYDALARSERRQTALVELGDRFRDIEEPSDMATAAAEVMGRTLDVSRVGYGTVDSAMESVTVHPDWRREGMTSVAGRYRFADFGTFIDDLKAGQTVVIDDVATDPRTSGHLARFEALRIRALLNQPVMERGKLVAILLLHDDQPRHWAPEKLAFVRDVAQRTRDAVERRYGEQHQRMLQGELQHRVKNTLAMVQAIASQTFRDGATADARSAFASRVIALSQANDVLTKAGWTAAQIRDVVTGATIPHCAPAERFTVEGPAIEIAAKAALALTLALHELCTNATKYGALSTEAGHVTVDWRVDAENVFRLRWTERGGPPVSAPTRTGFGTRLIARSLGPQLGGTAETHYAPEGVTFTMRAPLAAVQDVEGYA